MNYDFQLCNVAYFESSILGLNGFVGIDKIHISQSEQIYLYKMSCLSLHRRYIEFEQLLILKCNFIRLVLHEFSYVILRQTLKDFNISSPKTYEPTCQTYTSISKDKLLEAGILSEIELLNGRIDWIKSAKSQLNILFKFC